MLIFFSYSGPSGILGSAESRIPLKLELRGVIIDALSMNRLNKTESALTGGYLFLKYLLFQIIHVVSH